MSFLIGLIVGAVLGLALRPQFDVFSAAFVAAKKKLKAKR